MSKRRQKEIVVPPAGGLIWLVALFELLAFGLLSLQEGEGIDFLALGIGAVTVAILLIQYMALTRFFPDLDVSILVIANVLAGLGIILQYRLGVDVAIKQTQWYAISMACMCIALVLVRLVRNWSPLVYGYMLAGLALLALAAFFGIEEGGSRNWFAFAGVSFQPSEFVKVLLVFILASVLSKKRGFLHLAPLGGFLLAAVLLLVIQKDLGAAVLYFVTALILIYVGTSDVLLIGGALGAGVLGAIGSYHLFGHVRTRVEIWKNPWAAPLDSGYQIVQSLIAIASGGLFGLGLGLGLPRSVPAYRTDFIFAVICEEFGQIIGIAVILLYLVLVMRGIIIALRAHSRFDAILSYGCVTMIALQTFLIIGGVIKMIPLTGVTLPFVSYGGSSMVTNMVFIGVMQGIVLKNAANARRRADEAEFYEE
ncbi:MAG: FtsW/RodA/SpoVE family cell cycle protein [Christensenellales bacterium]|jgi:cell division protein FtsW (lipid II flippase)